MLLSLLTIVSTLLWAASWLIIIQAIVSLLVAFNVINLHSDFVRSLLGALDRITEPVYRPFRRLLPDFGGLDFAPLLVLILLWILRTLIDGAALDLANSAY